MISGMMVPTFALFAWTRLSKDRGARNRIRHQWTMMSRGEWVIEVVRYVTTLHAPLQRQFPVRSAVADLETLCERMVRNGGPYEETVQPRDCRYDKSNSITSDACLACRANLPSSLTAAPSLAESSMPLRPIPPRST
jgi:hypothetical protein